MIKHQSTFNPNMPLRGVFYFSRLYEVYIAQHKLDIYGSKLVKLPMPQYIIFYNGDADKPDRIELKLSDAFELPPTERHVMPALECTAVMLNINYGHNPELLEKCKRLKDYSIFTSKVKLYAKTCSSLNVAIEKAIDECIKEGVLMDILVKERTLARNSLLTEYNEKKRRKLDRQEGFEDGLSLGFERSIEAFVQDNISEGIDEVRIAHKLVHHFQVSMEKAQEYVAKYK